MKKSELIQLIANNMSNNTMDNIFPYLASDCKYFSDEKLHASDREAVKAFF